MTIILFIALIDYYFILWQFLCLCWPIMFWQLLKLFDQICSGNFCVCAYLSFFDNLWVLNNNWVKFGYKKATTLKIVTLLSLEKHNMLKITIEKSTVSFKFSLTHKNIFKYLKRILLITLSWNCFWLIHTHQTHFKFCQMFP